MLCCVSPRRVIVGRDRGLPYDQYSPEVRSLAGESEKVGEVELCVEPDVPPILLPCAICARTFMPQSLEKHTKICEQSTSKRRKPFDSAKQRIQGTELAEFLPKQGRRHHAQDDRSSKPRSTWKQTHDDFLQTIRAARSEVTESTMQKPCNSSATSSAPTRANEQGVCPTCNRHFGVKAYDRHVAWCKERIARVPVSPATNVAKERLEARMNYRAPALKNRRQTTRDKYSPGSTITFTPGNKTSPTTHRVKETVSAPNCNKGNDSPGKQKTVARRPGQTKESSPLGPMKSRAIDRVNRPPEDESRPAPFERTSHLPVPPLKHKRESLEEFSNPSPRKPSRRGEERVKDRSNNRVRQEERQASHSARSQKANIVSARSQGNPKLNDVSINAEAMGVTVKPCNIYKGNELTTWKRISQEKDQTRGATLGNFKDIGAVDLVSFERNDRIEEFPSKELLEEDTLRLTVEDPFKDDASRVSSRSGSMGCSTATSKLNRTYSFRDSACDGMDEVLMNQRKWKPVRHSPRIEFCFDDPEKVNRMQPLSLGFTSPKGVAPKNDSEKSCTNSKAKNVGKERSKHALIRADEVNRFEKDSNQKDSDLEGSRVRPSDGSSMKSSLERKGSRPATFSKTGSSENVQSFNNPDSLDLSKNFGESSAIVGNALNERVSAMEDQNLANFESLKCGPASNRNLNAKMKNIDESLMGPEPKLRPLASKQSSYSDKFDASFDKSNVIANEICEQNVNESILSNTNKETNEIDGAVNIAGKHFDFNSSEQNMAESFQDQLEKSSSFFPRNEVFNNIENEPDAFLIKDILRPSRSSTPFEKIEGNPPCPMHEVQKEKSRVPFANCEWKMSVDTERGAEMLYRVEANNSNRLDTSVHDNELQEANFGNEPSKLKISSSNRSSVSSKTIDTVQSVAGAVSYREQKKDTASQINICNCSLNISEDISNEEVINDRVERNPDLEEQVCNGSLQNKSPKSHNILEKSSERQTSVKSDVEKIGPEANQREDDIQNREMKLNTSFVEPGPTSEQHVDKNGLKNRSRLFIQPSDETENEEVQEIYKNPSTKDFDYDSDNTVDEQIAEDNVDFKTPRKSDKIDVRNFRSILLSESRVELKKSLTSRSTALRSRKSRTLEIEKKVNRVHENLCVLNDSSDSSASLADAMDFTNVKQVESVEVETIEEIGTRNRSIRFRILPEIRKSSSVVVKERRSEGHKLGAETYWEKARRAAKSRLINLDPPCQGARFLKKNPKVCVLPPVPSNTSLIRCSGKDYDPFLLAEQQMNELLSDTSEQSVTDSPLTVDQNRESSFPLSHSSAFVKYSYASPDKRSALAPPSEFEDLASDFSSDSTETNSLSREVFLKHKEFKDSGSKSDVEKKSPVRELGRRVIIDKSKALGGDSEDSNRRSLVPSTEKARKVLDKVSPKVLRPTVTRSFSIRASSAPKTNPDRKTLSNPQDSKKSLRNESQRSSNTNLNHRNNNYVNLSTSNLSLSSIVSSDADIKRSNSVFDELMTSFEDQDGPFPSLKSLLKNNSLSSPVHGRQRNEHMSDEELSSPESYKRQDHSKMSGDSAYSSLNRKYSNHGRSTNDVAGRVDEDLSRSNRRDSDSLSTTAKCKMSKFCHECGSKFPETAKFCCECGIRRLVL